LYPRDVGSVHVGQPVQISVNGYPDLVFHGVIDNISDAVDPTTLTLKARVVLANPQHKLKPQMYATIAVTNQKGEAIVVPSTAVIQNGKEAFVFVETSPGKYARRTVVLGATHQSTDEITQGLEDGDKIVATGAELLRESEDQ
jgi:membrane fusion protein, heavy metal efflux system